MREVLESGEAGAGEEAGEETPSYATGSFTGLARAVAVFFSESNTMMSTTTRHSP